MHGLQNGLHYHANTPYKNTQASGKMSAWIFLFLILYKIRICLLTLSLQAPDYIPTISPSFIGTQTESRDYKSSSDYDWSINFVRVNGFETLSIQTQAQTV